MLFDRLERHWRARTAGGTLAEKLFVAARLAPEMARGDGALRSHFADGIKLLMSRRLRSDPGQLLYVLDSYDFARFMRRYLSPRWAENYRTFENPEGALREESDELLLMQWQNAKAVRRTKHALPVIP